MISKYCTFIHWKKGGGKSKHHASIEKVHSLINDHESSSSFVNWSIVFSFAKQQLYRPGVLAIGILLTLKAYRCTQLLVLSLKGFSNWPFSSDADDVCNSFFGKGFRTFFSVCLLEVTLFAELVASLQTPLIFPIAVRMVSFFSTKKAATKCVSYIIIKVQWRD